MDKASNIFIKRYNWIDWAKTICMFLVVLGHSHLENKYLVQTIYSFHMPLFFILSGMLCKSTLSLKSIKKDIKYILLPYYIYGIISIIFVTSTSHSFNTHIILRHLIDLLSGYNNNIGAIWFLMALFFTKIIYYGIKYLSKDNIYPILITMFISSPFIYIIKKTMLNLPLFIDSALCALPFFLFGTILGNQLKKISNISKKTLVLLIITCTYTASSLVKYNGGVDLSTCAYGNNLILYHINAFSYSIALISACILLNNIHLNFITISSYGTIAILGFHGYFLYILNYLIPHRLGIPETINSIPISILYSVISFYFCYLTILLLDNKYYYLCGLKGHFVSIIREQNKRKK